MTVALKDRTENNIPTDSNGEPLYDILNWLRVEKPFRFQKVDNYNYGKACNGSWVAWNDNKICVFKIGDVIKKDDIGNYQGIEFTIESEWEQILMARSYAKIMTPKKKYSKAV